MSIQENTKIELQPNNLEKKDTEEINSDTIAIKYPTVNEKELIDKKYSESSNYNAEERLSIMKYISANIEKINSISNPNEISVYSQPTVNNDIEKIIDGKMSAKRISYADYTDNDKENNEKAKQNENSNVSYIIPKRSKFTKGSLLDLFKSELFTMHLLINYMNKFSDSTIFDCLVNEIYERYINTCYFYLPQLCSMLVYKDSYSLEQFLTEHCTDRLKFAVKIFWLIMSFKKSNSQLENKAVKIEIAMVNNKVRKLRGSDSNGETTPLNLIYQKSLSKEIRLNYFIKLCNFYDQLTIMCDNLMKIEKEKREKSLEEYIHKLNINISKLKTHINKDLKSDINSLFHYGYLLPFDDCESTYDEETNIIVRILPEHSKCYTSKARVPVKLTFETVKVKETKNWEELIETDPEGINYTNVYTDNGSLKQVNQIIEYDSIDDFLKKNGLMSADEVIENQDQIQENKESTEKHIIEKENREQVYEDGKLTEEQYIEEIVSFEKNKEPGLKKMNSFSNNNNNQLINDEKELNNNSIKNNEDDEKLVKNIEISSYNCKSNLFGLVDWKTVDPKFNPFGKPWAIIKEEIKEKSKYRNFPTYQVKSYIYKSNDDLKQELMILQLIKRCQEIFDLAGLPLKLGVYEILITSDRSGMIEVIPDTCSIDQIKKAMPEYFTLKDFFLKVFGMNYEEAQINFAQSLAAYSIVCYIFQIKDRHNGNILIDNCGHLIHIDFGFVLGISPGNLNFESVPFKLTQEYIDILGGMNSEIYEYYILLIMKGLLEMRKHIDNFLSIIQIMKNGCEMPCFVSDYFETKISEFKQRFYSVNNEDYYTYARNLVTESSNSWRTNKYDSFQKFSNGILY